MIKRQECSLDTGKYLAEVVQKVCALCEKCIMGAGTPVCVGRNTQAIQVGGLTLATMNLGTNLAVDPALVPARADMTLVSGSGDQECEDCRKAADPNAITGPEGDVLSGQLVTYKIEYENVGAGTAFGVFVVNPLSEYFDLDTLVVHDPAPGFTLSKNTRRLFFQVGDLAGKGSDGSKGQVTYSVRIKAGLPSGTAIVNDAVVHFPSVPEETPTNTVVNIIQPIAVPSQKLQVVAGQALAITLAGQDAAGGALTFALVNSPLYGTLTGTPPALTYTPQANFAGIDRLTFTANNGTSTSRLAEVVIEVLPAGNDSTPPTVKWTGPENGAVVNGSQQVAFHDSGALYTPYIQVQFSEGLAAGTVNTTTVEVKNGAGQLVPVSVQYDATIDQAVILMHEQGVTDMTYTVTLKPGITDLTGNPLATYSWNFRFGEAGARGGRHLLALRPTAAITRYPLRA